VRCRSCGALFLPETSSAPTAVIPSGEVSTEDVSNWVENKRHGAGPSAWSEKLASLSQAIDAPGRRPRLYDVGAGAGEFLALARDVFGFDVVGNEILEGSLPLAKQMSNVDLELGDLSALAHEEDVDAVTLWCVLAHVSDGEQLMRDVHRMLRPGGVAYLQTPNRTLADRASNALKTATGGRVSRLPDRRLAGHHRILHTRASITRLLERVGFADVQAVPQVRYAMSSRAYLASLRAPEWSVSPASWLMDKAIAGGVVPRITLDVWARKPR
jgi:SAM-dependent methyltransferase